MGGETETNVQYGQIVDEQELLSSGQQQVALSAIEQFPNPMGKWADVGNFRDFWWFVMWAASSLTIIGFGVANYVADPTLTGSDSSASFLFDEGSNGGTSKYMQQAAFALLLTSFLCLFHLALMQTYPVTLIRVSAIITILLMIAGVVIFVITKEWFMAILFGVITVINILFTAILWKSDRMFFAALCMQLSAKSATTYWGVTVNAFSWVVIQFAFFLACLSMLVSTNGTDTASRASFWIGVLVLYWGSEVFKNIVHVTTSGVVSEWFFKHMGPQTPAYAVGSDRPTLGALGRAVSWSIGSICFGSLIVAIIRTIRMMLRGARRGNHIVVLLIDCILGCIEGLMRYFNDYAYVQVAMFGKSYLTAAGDTWKLVKDGTAWDALINDNLTDFVYMVFIILATALVAVSTAFLGHVSNFDDISFDLTGLIIGIVIAFLITSIMMKVIYSGVLTIFIGFWQLKAAQVAWSPAPLGDIPVEELNVKLDSKYSS